MKTIYVNKISLINLQKLNEAGYEVNLVQNATINSNPRLTYIYENEIKKFKKLNRLSEQARIKILSRFFKTKMI